MRCATLGVPLVSAAMAVLVAGCFPRLEIRGDKGGVSDSRGGGADTGVAGSIDVTEVSPGGGTTAGGSTVTVRGGPFVDDDVVRIGGAAATVLSVDAHAIEIKTPPGTEGTADVEVSGSTGSGMLADGFRYYADAKGKAVALVELGYIEIANPDQWSGTPPTNYVSAMVVGIEPADVEAKDLVGSSVDTCEVDYPWPSVTLTSLGPTVSLSVGAGSYDLTESSVSGFYSDVFNPDGGTVGAGYGLGASGTDDDGWPAFSIDEVAQVPNAFAITSPEVYRATPPTLGSSDFTFKWDTPFITKTYAGLWITDGTNDLYCLVEDDGSFTVPQDDLENAFSLSWLNPTYLQVTLTRYQPGSATGVWFNDGEVRGQGAYAIVTAVALYGSL